MYYFCNCDKENTNQTGLAQLKMSRSLAPEPPLSLGKDSFVVHNTDLSSSTFRIKLIKVSGYQFVILSCFHTAVECIIGLQLTYFKLNKKIFFKNRKEKKINLFCLQFSMVSSNLCEELSLWIHRKFRTLHLQH